LYKYVTVFDVLLPVCDATSEFCLCSIYSFEQLFCAVDSSYGSGSVWTSFSVQYAKKELN